jgi:Leucine-rich repeat (LRR) protein
MSAIREMQTLGTICIGERDAQRWEWPAAEFWKKYDAGEFGKPDSAAIAPESKPNATLNDPAFQAWMKEVSVQPAEKQVEAVAKKLQELNPGFNGKVWPKVEDGAVVQLIFDTDSVTDISPVRALARLTGLHCHGTSFGRGKLSDLSPLKGMSLTDLNCGWTQVSDLSPLKGMRLERLNCDGDPVSDLSPLEGMSLTELICDATRVSDLSPLQGAPLTLLVIDGARVSDLSPLRGMSLTILAFTPSSITKGTDAIRKMNSLTTIGIDFDHKWPSGVLWKKYDAGEFGKPPTDINDPAFQAWMKDVAVMPAEQQVEAVAKKLQELNPGFAGKVKPKIEQGAVREIGFGMGAAVTNIAPVRALAKLRALTCQWGKLTDLSPLSGASVGYLFIDGNPFSDLSPLKGMLLRQLSCNSCTKLADLSPLAGMPLTFLDVGGTCVSDLSPLRGTKLEELYLTSNYVSDLSPLEGLQLKSLTFSPQQITRGIDVIRRMPSLNSIGIGGQKWYPPTEFWKKYDAGEFGKPAAANH